VFISAAYNLNADVASAAADRAYEQQAHLHSNSELQNRARRSKPEHSGAARSHTTATRAP